jgi:murein DD-endopeptidase MepM/ murein hydrolase activator NlpD
LALANHTTSKTGANSYDKARQTLGLEPALISGNGRRAPDKRKVSLRWMSGSVLTGFTSALLMGGALYAALDGRQQLAEPANLLEKLNNQSRDGLQALLGDRPVAIVALKPANEKVMQVPTVTRVGDSNVIRKRPFAYASAPLAIAPQRKVNYPAFNPLEVFRSSSSDKVKASSDVIYSAEIESEVRLKTGAFPLDTAQYDTSTEISTFEAEAIVREAMVSLEEGGISVAALPYLDTSRFELKQEDIEPTSGLNIRIVNENVSTMLPTDDDDPSLRLFDEEVISVPAKQTLAQALEPLELQPATLTAMQTALIGELGTKALPKGTKLRVAWERPKGDETASIKIARRISVYRAGQHIKSVALNDEEKVVWATEPTIIAAVEDSPAKEKEIQTVSRSNLPNIYDGIYRAALSQGLNKEQSKRIVRTVAFDVDFRAKSRPDDDLEVFYSLDEGQTEATSDSEILYIGLTLGGTKRTYYRYKAGDDGSVDYYDENGKSAKKFLLRKPVPNGKFRSPFGPRRHPISRRVKMHQGVDFSAPRGTPIISAGNGVVEKSGWAGGYGRQLIIRHANGYKTSYNHMHRFARGMKAGARVRLGQIIGQVGSTGYSTGPHLHYEVIVNGNKVNPMKIRLPQGRALKGNTLKAFMRERDRINALVERGRSGDTKVAALN